MARDLTDPLLAIASLGCRWSRDVPSTCPTDVRSCRHTRTLFWVLHAPKKSSRIDDCGELMGTEMPEDKNNTNTAADEHEHIEGDTVDHNDDVVAVRETRSQSNG